MRKTLSLFSVFGPAAIAALALNGACGGSSSTAGDDGGTGSSSGSTSGGSTSGSGSTSSSGSSTSSSGGSSGTSSSGSGTSSGSTSGGSTSGSTSGSGTSSSGGSSGSTSGGSSSGSTSGSSSGTTMGHIKTIFLIVMENHNWQSATPPAKTDIYMNSAAPYINSLLSNPQASWCSNYYDNPNKDHPSEPNYIWLEAATDSFSDAQESAFATDLDPSASTGNITASTGHLATMLSAKGVTWREYAEDMPGSGCPTTSSGNFAAKHVPFVFFSDVTSGGCPTANFRPYTSLSADLVSGDVAQYNFITPNLCNDMHGGTISCLLGDQMSTGDTWLSQQIPMIMQSKAYKDNGAIFITWDESENGEYPIGMIVLSPLAKGNGYKSTTMYYHSSMVRTVQEVFGLSPLLNDAANQPNLGDLFTSFP